MAMEKQWKFPMKEDIKEAYVNLEMKYPDGDYTKSQELQRFYDKWTDGYDDDMRKLRYMAPGAIAEQAAKLTTKDEKANWKVLDVGSGTGLAGLALREQGFEGEFTALDYAQKMLEKSKSLDNLYTSYHEHCLTASNPLPFEDSSFNLIVVAGSFGPEAIQPDCLKEVIRTLGPGGCLVLTTRISEVMTSYNDMLFEAFGRLTSNGTIGEVSKEVFDQYNWETSETETERLIGFLVSCRKL